MGFDIQPDFLRKRGHLFSFLISVLFWSPIGVDHIRQCRQGFQSSMNSHLAAALWLAVHLSLFLSPQARSACALSLAWGCYSLWKISSLPPASLVCSSHSFKDPLFCWPTSTLMRACDWVILITLITFAYSSRLTVKFIMIGILSTSWVFKQLVTTFFFEYSNVLKGNIFKTQLWPEMCNIVLSVTGWYWNLKKSLFLTVY